MLDLKICTKDKNLVLRVKENILENKLIDSGDTVIAALSGGADSVCLLYILNELKKEFNFTLKAAHLNHGIRGEEANRDEDFAKKLCEKMNIGFFSKFCDIPALSGGKNTELVARKARYAFFSELSQMENGAKIAVAHNKNDVAETMVMRLIRGTSVFGFSGIPVKNGNIIRPLLNVSREEIEEFLKSKKIAYVTDSTNLSDDYTRNKIRHKILPEMKEINEGYLKTIANTASRMAAVASFVEGAAKEAYGEITDVIDVSKLSGLHDVIKEYVISEAAYTKGIEELSEKNISDIKALMTLESGRQIDIPGGFKAIKVYSEIKFIKEEKALQYNYELKPGKNYIKEADMTIIITEGKKGIDKDRITLPLIARPRKSGDFIETKGISGKKKIKNLYIDEKLPIDKRAIYPLILSGNDVVFALGRCNKKYISDENTKEAYNIKITEGDLSDVE